MLFQLKNVTLCDLHRRSDRGVDSAMRPRTSKPSVEAASRVASDSEKPADRGLDSGMRPRTATLPWDLLRGVRSADVDPLRPRSSSGGNAAAIREAVRTRIAAARQSVIASRSMSGFSAESSHQLSWRRRPELECPPDPAQETGEYVEMHCPAATS